MKRVLTLLCTLLFFATADAGHCSYQPQLDWEGPCFSCNLPNAAFCASNWIGMNGFFGEFLYWNFCGDGLRWASKLTENNVTTGPYEDKEIDYLHKFDFSPGFRLGFHHIFPCTENDMTFTWTYYWNSHSDAVSALSGGGTSPVTIINIFSPYVASPPIDIFTDNVEQAFNSSMNFRLNRFDFTFGQNAHYWNCVVVNYYAGGVFWATDENLFVEGNYTLSGTAELDETNTFKTSYRGAGAQLGLRLNWQLWDCLVFSVDGGFAGTVGPYDLKYNTIGTEPVAANSYTYFNPVSYWTGRYAANLGLAVRFTLSLCNQCVLYSSLGWEYFQYFNQTSFQVRDTGTNQNGFTQAPTDAVVHGLTFTLGTTF